ncbi:MAG: serine/threonine-protein kinase [Gemmataceae bacterium]
MKPAPVKDTMQTLGNYDLLEKIAEGGMGAIYRGRDRGSGQTVAIKVMPPHMAANPVLLKRFEQEFRAASRLDHPNIVRALDYNDAGTSPYLVMEFVDGESLGQKIERDGQMSEADAIRIIAQVAQGLHRAHKLNLVHRDVKPDNILIRADGMAKLADLGLVKETETDLNLTKTGRGLGTPHFMAPEQFRNAKNADVRCDIYSLGATLYNLVTGQLPFRSSGPLDAWMKKVQNDLTPPRNLVPGLSERVNWAILRAMSADPEQRPASCREFIEDLTGHSTRRVPTASATGLKADLWYLIYRDDEGGTHTVKGTTTAIRRSLKDGLLGDAANVRAGRNKGGPFESLREYPEFRDLLITAAPMPVVAAPSRVAPPSTVRPTGTEPSTTAYNPYAAGGSAADQPAVAPHIAMAGEGDGDEVSWKTWVLFFAIAFASAVAAFFLLPGWMRR